MSGGKEALATFMLEKSSAKRERQPSPTRPAGSRRGKASAPPQWQCLAYLHGRLKRDLENQRLFFECSDSTLFPIQNFGRGDGKAIAWMFLHLEECFEKDSLWMVYPSSLKGEPTVTPVAIVEKPDVKADLLTFRASVGNQDADKYPNTLPLFIGRNGGAEYHFLNLLVPEELELPELQPRQRVCGHARREGDRWLLLNVEAT